MSVQRAADRVAFEVLVDDLIRDGVISRRINREELEELNETLAEKGRRNRLPSDADRDPE